PAANAGGVSMNSSLSTIAVLTRSRASNHRSLAGTRQSIRHSKAINPTAATRMTMREFMSLLPLPLRERAGVRGNRADFLRERSRIKATPSTPHPNPLPQGERGPENSPMPDLIPSFHPIPPAADELQRVLEFYTVAAHELLG